MKHYMKQGCLIVEFMTNTIIFTPPRTGRIFLLCAFQELTGVWLESENSNHQRILNDFEFKIGLAKDPKKTIASLSTMIKEKDNVPIIKDVESAMTTYNNFMLSLINKDVRIYDHNDLRNNTEKMLMNIILTTKSAQIKKYNYDSIIKRLDNFEKQNQHGYLKTFTDKERYLVVNNIINDLNLSESYDLYSKALSKSIKLS